MLGLDLGSSRVKAVLWALEEAAVLAEADETSGLAAVPSGAWQGVGASMYTGYQGATLAWYVERELLPSGARHALGIYDWAPHSSPAWACKARPRRDRFRASLKIML